MAPVQTNPAFAKLPPEKRDAVLAAQHRLELGRVDAIPMEAAHSIVRALPPELRAFFPDI
jgi:hypothetical protein